MLQKLQSIFSAKRLLQAVSLCLFLAILFVVSVARHPQADVTADCNGKPYGTSGCPLKSTSSSATTPTTCGNGVLDSGEECDLGKNRNGLSNCTKDCRLLYCGDGLTSPGNNEECDPADPALGQVEEVYAKDPTTGELIIERHYLQPACGSICTVPVCDANSVCAGGCKRKFLRACASDGMPSTELAASDGVTATKSTASAGAVHLPPAPARCGDGSVQPGEECDDGNKVNNDNCTSSCRLPVCGDSIIQPWEQCDDGNKVDGDGCSNDCKLPACGDGVVQAGEECDDGNSVNNDACSNNCKLPRCGDGTVQQPEECDDGNSVDNDGCTNSCKRPRCGDAIVQPGEECDDGNTENDDSCTNSCKLPRCGDGIRQPSEECDDGNRLNEDGCSNLCKLPVCGDAIKEAGEECDDGNKIDGDACTNTCKQPRCGDGVLQAGEECDDGNQANDDVCSNTCKLPRCGDSIVQAGEECDSGRSNSNAEADACRKNCRAARCGDKVTDSGEECDGGESCTNDCKVTHAAAPVPSSGFPVGWAVAALGFGVLGILGALAYVYRDALHFTVGKSGKKKGASSIDDIPLDEIEMPWHKW